MLTRYSLRRTDRLLNTIILNAFRTGIVTRCDHQVTELQWIPHLRFQHSQRHLPAGSEPSEHVLPRRIRALITPKAVFEGKNLVLVPLALLATKGEHVASAPRCSSSSNHKSMQTQLSSRKCFCGRVPSRRYSQWLNTCRLNVRRGLSKQLDTLVEEDIISLSFFRPQSQPSGDFGGRESAASPADNRTRFDGADSNSARKVPAQALAVVDPVKDAQGRRTG